MQNGYDLIMLLAGNTLWLFFALRRISSSKMSFEEFTYKICVLNGIFFVARYSLKM